MLLSTVSTGKYLNLHVKSSADVVSKEFKGGWSQAKIVKSTIKADNKELNGK